MNEKKYIAAKTYFENLTIAGNIYRYNIKKQKKKKRSKRGKCTYLLATNIFVNSIFLHYPKKK